MKYLIPSLIYLCISLYAQINDTFSGSKLNNWQGDTTKFTITSNTLQSNGLNATNQRFYISAANQLINDTEWEFLVDLKFNPTASNFTRIYLAADTDSLSGPLNGYFLQFGETNADTLDFYKQAGTKVDKIFTGKTAFASNLKTKIKVTRNATGIWQFYTDAQALGPYTYEGSITDNSFTETKCFGLFCQYATASRYNQFYFDDVSIKKIEKDTIKPFVLKTELTSDSSFTIYYSEKIFKSIIKLTNNQFKNFRFIGNDSSKISYYFENKFTKGQALTIYIDSLIDINGNITQNLIQYIIIGDNAMSKEIIFTELMVDEDPSQGLPEREYIEIYNKTNRYFNTKGCFLKDGTKTYTFPDSTLQPQNYYLLCSQTASIDFASVANKIVFPTIPALTNTGKNVELYCNSTLIDAVNYTNDWYNDKTKAEGGWSLEIRDLDNPCLGSNNWKASVVTIGGTPSIKNSVYEKITDINAPKLQVIEIKNDTLIQLQFDEAIYKREVWEKCIKSANLLFKIDTVQKNKGIIQLIAQKLDSNTNYHIQIEKLMDCTGNNITSIDTTITLPKSVKNGDILINEVLFDASEYVGEYVEIYNNSDRNIDLKNLYVSKLKNNNLYNSKIISTNSIIIKSNTLIIITESTKNEIFKIYSNVDTNNIIILDSWPSFTDDSGTVVIHAENGTILDQFHYDEDYHSPILNNTEGVALEKILKNAPSNAPTNWKSAAETANFGTPTQENSQLLKENGTATLSTKVVSPDGDGRDDYCLITLKSHQDVAYASLKIVDSEGRVIKTIAQNTSLASESQFTWDGTTDKKTKAALGQYLLVVEYQKQGNNATLERYGIAVFE